MDIEKLIQTVLTFCYKLLFTVLIFFGMFGLFLNYGLWGMVAVPAMALAISWLWDRK